MQKLERTFTWRHWWKCSEVEEENLRGRGNSESLEGALTGCLWVVLTDGWIMHRRHPRCTPAAPPPYTQSSTKGLSGRAKDTVVQYDAVSAADCSLIALCLSLFFSFLTMSVCTPVCAWDPEKATWIAPSSPSLLLHQHLPQQTLCVMNFRYSWAAHPLCLSSHFSHFFLFFFSASLALTNWSLCLASVPLRWLSLLFTFTVCVWSCRQLSGCVHVQRDATVGSCSFTAMSTVAVDHCVVVEYLLS